MAFLMEVETVDSSMGLALGYLDRVAEHLRGKGETLAANEIAKSALEIVSSFHDATEGWDDSDFRLQKRQVPQPNCAEKTASLVSKPVEPYAEHAKVIQSGCWAKIAAIPAPEGNPIIKHGPGDSLVRYVIDEEPPPQQVIGPDKRVIWVKPFAAGQGLDFITDQIQEGPLFSAAYSEKENAACVIFQHAEHAAAFLNSNEELKKRTGCTCYGKGYDIIVGAPYPWDENLERMDTRRERRRLTFARQGLFTGSFSERHFRRNVEEVAGKENVQLIWLFNTGNATVVLSGVTIARMVRAHFLAKGQEDGPYKQVAVTYSSDPCEKPLNLVSQIPQSEADWQRIRESRARQWGGEGDRYQSNGRGREQGDLSGWQKVKRK